MGHLTSTDRIYDLVGVGFGPSNLALAATIREEAQSHQAEEMSALFLESKREFAWHPDMLIKGATIQLSFLKDLVTLRNPQSQYSFLIYLQQAERLVDFVNLRTFFPSRAEFNDYYCWVADQLEDMVRYGQRVTSIEPIEGEEGQVDLIRVTFQDLANGSEHSCLARNLVFATGGTAKLPEGIETTDDGRVFHCGRFLSQVETHFPDRGKKHEFVVVGSGQSAVEIFQYLYETYPKAAVTATLRRFAYQPADESHFVNTIFHPEMTDFLYDLPEADRKQLIAEHYDTNYSAVDLDLLGEVYKELYERRVVGDTLIKVRSMLELREVELLDGGRVRAHFFDKIKQVEERIEADSVMLATGYQRNGIPPLLKSLSRHLRKDNHGRLDVDRQYRAVSGKNFAPQIFLQGFCEHTHGLSDTLLSVLPMRSKEIHDELSRERLQIKIQTDSDLREPVGAALASGRRG